MTLYTQIGKLIESQFIRERKKMDDGLLLLKAQISFLWPYIPDPKMGIAVRM